MGSGALVGTGTLLNMTACTSVSVTVGHCLHLYMRTIMEVVVSETGGLLCYAGLGLNLSVHVLKKEDTYLHTSFAQFVCEEGD